ncbi:ATP-binding protein [uncultured Clostridium sp.]|uniref:ATP-binding protein n=1 Tax=uncultured Clostridium sp. TaxID=59620 RepID=UPI0025ECFAF4|nr:ATP-binding protein [uncultured Clostridium sp.]
MGAKENILKNLRMKIKSLCVFNSIKEDVVVNKLYRIMDLLDNKEDIDIILDSYNDFTYELINNNGGSLKRYFIDKLISKENLLSKTVEERDTDKISYIKDVANKELSYIKEISEVNSREIKEIIISSYNLDETESIIIESLMDWNNNMEYGYKNSPSYIDKFKKSIFDSRDWNNTLDNLIDFYKKYGCGEFATYRAFVWENSNNVGNLKGIDKPDSVRLSELIGYKSQQEEIIKNTLNFLKGYSANNILLYGDRGTGKSSTVKAIINEYYSMGLRLVELKKENLRDFTKIIRLLKNKPQKFIIFIDDLVFEENEDSYSAMKTILDGGVENRPDNMIIYATTNRRHLVKETFADRAGLGSSNSNEEIYANDTIQEKLSLSDRFGITISFMSPDQNKFFEIVEGLVKARGIEVDREYLFKEAKKWELWYNGRSARTARQFVDWLEGEIGAGEEG